MFVLFLTVGSVGLNYVVTQAFIPLTIILVIIHIVLLVINIISNCSENDEKTIIKIPGNIFYGLGEIIRSFISITFFLCVCKGFLINFSESDGLFETVFAFIIVLSDLLVAALIFITSFGITTLSNNIISEDDNFIFGGILNFILSILFFILIQALICNFYSEVTDILFKNVPILKRLFSFSESIIYKIYIFFKS